MSTLIRINDLDGLKAAGLPFVSVDAARWCERTADEKGLRPAFVAIKAQGKRKRIVYIDPAKFHELARKQSAAA